MVIKFTTSLVGHGFHFDAGDSADLPDDEAKRLIVAGFAEPEPVKVVEDIETAELTHEALEQAILPAPLVIKHNPLPANPKAAK